MTIKYWRLVILVLAPLSALRADQIEMQNGDRYSGAVVSMTPETVVLQSELLGQLKLPRNKVSTIALGASNNAAQRAGSTNNPASASPALTAKSAADPSGPFRQLGANSNLVQQIRKQFLGDAAPEANDKFDELLNGLMTGKMDMDGLRAEAKSAADKLRAMKKDAGADADITLDAYIGVLDSFLAETPPPPAAPGTNNAQGSIIIR